jgi:hypothetical protein
VPAVTVLVVAEGLAILLLALLVAGLLRSHAEILRSLHELGAAPYDEGSRDHPAPTRHVRAAAAPAATDIVGTTPDGDGVVAGVSGGQHDSLLAFLSSGCTTCASFWDAFTTVETLGLPPGARLVVVTKGPDVESISAVRALAPPGVTVVMSTEAWDAYEVPVVPYFVHVDGPSGRVVGQGAGSTWEQVASLMGQALGDVPLPTPGVRKARADAEREARADRELLRAGIKPGDASLYPTSGPGPTDGGPGPA